MGEHEWIPRKSFGETGVSQERAMFGKDKDLAQEECGRITPFGGQGVNEDTLD